MKASENANTISFETFQFYVSAYESKIPPKIQGLENLRLKELPETVSQRKKDGDAFLEKTEVTALLEWKLCVLNQRLQSLSSDG